MQIKLNMHHTVVYLVILKLKNESERMKGLESHPNYLFKVERPDDKATVSIF